MTARLIVIGGFAGAGKSTLARSLGQALGLPFYELDLVGQAIADSKYFKGENAQAVAYDLFWVYARNQLENGCSLIFDQNMGQVWQWTKIKEICDSIAGVEQLIFILDCPYDVCVERANARTNHPGAGGKVNWDDHKFKWDYLNENEFPGVIRIDATRSQEEVLNEVKSFIEVHIAE